MPAHPSTPATALQLGFAGLPGTPAWHLSVDGRTPTGPNLSHWPGNRTPPAWKADLSTGICLNFARARPDEQESFLQGATVVLNDHYDTDGFGSLLAVLHPEIALPREELLLAAAATGDFGVFVTRRAFAIDRIVLELGREGSPAAAALRGLEGPARSLARYKWLLAHAAEVLDRPETMAPLFADEMGAVLAGLDASRRGAVAVRRHDEVGLAAATSHGPVHRMVLNTLAGAYRILHVEQTENGPLYRYHDRTESWFELSTFRTLPRRDLRPLAERLGALEPPRDGARWCADPPTEPIPELYFGLPAAQEYGRVTRERRPSRLPPAEIELELLAFFSLPPEPAVAGPAPQPAGDRPAESA